MAELSHEYSDFPNSFYSLHNFLDLKDAPNSVLEVVTKIKTFVSNGNYNQAALLLKDYKNILGQYIIDARFINALDEELRNLEIYTKAKKQALYYQNNEPDGVTGDVWIA